MSLGNARLPPRQKRKKYIKVVPSPFSFLFLFLSLLLSLTFYRQLLTRVNTTYVKMAESTLTEQKSAPSGPIIVFIGRSNTAPDEQVKRELLETLHRVEQINMEEYGSLDSRSVDFIPIIQGSKTNCFDRVVRS